MIEQKFSDEQFTEALEKVVARAGADFVYSVPNSLHDGTANNVEVCLYVDPETGEPSCLIAQALAELNIKLDPEWDEVISQSADEVMVPLGFSTRVAEAAAEAQRVQDNRKPWGSALESYYNTLNS